MATAIQRAIEVARTISGNSPWTLAFPEAASQTFKKGAFVTLDASGRVVECGADPARILGIAAADGANDSVAGNSSTTVWIAGDDTIFVGNVGLTGALTQVTANTDVGGRYGISKNAASPTNWMVDKTDGCIVGGTTANAKVIVTNIDPRDAVGDIGGKVEFMIMSAASILTGTSPYV